mmetsp:Transcript_5484/g.15367  ORF Transcript_5484/g.15367 Transcript_5484/m.15367 type:complete len:232 (+) Transcript_5484:129-824(+)
MSNNSFGSVKSVRPSARSACSWLTNAPKELPSTNSRMSANSPLFASMAAPCSATMCECRTRLKRRISLQKEATDSAVLREAAPRGTLMATGDPWKRPTATQPNPPRPQITGGFRTSMSRVATSQCSRTPIFATCSSAARIEEDTSRPVQREHSWLMSLKTRSVAVDVAVLTRSTSMSASVSRAPSAPMWASASSWMASNSTSFSSRFGVCSTWLTPTRAQVEAPPMATMAN